MAREWRGFLWINFYKNVYKFTGRCYNKQKQAMLSVRTEKM